MPKPTVTLENWSVIRGGGSLSFEQLRPGAHLMGFSSERANLPGRNFVRTSRILNVDTGMRLVETVNTVYRLGSVDEAYTSWGL
jgi:hypothetical protein